MGVAGLATRTGIRGRAGLPQYGGLGRWSGVFTPAGAGPLRAARVRIQGENRLQGKYIKRK
ncbi:hypothetical protein C8C98_1485 [Acidovorax sp. 106]|nr:hypothetical protein C8C98_1485 [Acidovorax sp. 106]